MDTHTYSSSDSQDIEEIGKKSISLDDRYVDPEFEELWHQIQEKLPPTYELDIIGEVHSVYYYIYTELSEKLNTNLKKLKPFFIDIYKWASELYVKNPELIYCRHKKLNKLFIRKKQLLSRKYRWLPKNLHLRGYYILILQTEQIERNEFLDKLLISTPMRSLYGITNYSSLISPYPTYRNKAGKIIKRRFTCKSNCYFCPHEVDPKTKKAVMPRSYLLKEPACARAHMCNFCAVLQTYDRGTSYTLNGHPVDKGEFQVLGGTWSSVDPEYQEFYIRNLYYACNTWPYGTTREPLSLEEEMHINETSASFRMIGLTLETRPDTLTVEELKRLRSYNCTRLQLGVQTNHNDLLEKINRGHTIEQVVDGMKRWRDISGKSIIHIMPDLPGSTPERDIETWDYMIDSEDLQPDELKVYPCEVVPWTLIEKWYKSGEYIPYAEKNPEDLLRVILHLKRRSIDIPWCRFTRIIRDIPNDYIIAGNAVTNLRQVLIKRLESEGHMCWCTRCRSVKEDIETRKNAKLFVRKYQANEGTEYFISFESADQKKLHGFCRLRITRNMHPAAREAFPILINRGMIRELHVYGKTLNVKHSSLDRSSQHIGFGKRLIREAERIALREKCLGMSIIAGTGVRNYYRKRGYILKDTYMIKDFLLFQRVISPMPETFKIHVIAFLVIIVLIIVIKFYLSF